MADWNPRANELFIQVVEIPDMEARHAFLDRACGADVALRAVVEKLLSAHEQADEFLKKPHPAAVTGDRTATYASQRSPDEAAGTVIAGRYKLLQQIGEGGMGSVWMADQLEPVKRRVAVKLVRTDREGSQSILSRFEAERQAIALMDHPNIAKLLDAGATGSDGANRPFFVMELVKGVPLTEYCDQHRLNITERLNLFTQICSAVQHAHQKGIIHRDLKPNNILVEAHDGKPVPKVIDFGLAKAMSGQPLTEHTLFTALGTVAGTPLYMAPEQAVFNAIDVDTRADIYALGVILYELLTGSTPIERRELKKAAFEEILRVIRESEPPTPSKRLSSTESKPSVAANRQTEPVKLSRFLRGDLDWIVMKALAKERDRRYETANGLAKDIERFMNQEPVQAGPPTTSYRLRKFVARNKGPVIAASLILLCLLTGIIGTSAGMVWAVNERNAKAEALTAEILAKEAEIKQREAKERALIATTKAKDAEKQARDAEKQARDKAMEALRALTDEIVMNQMARGATLTDENKEFLRTIIKHFEGFAAVTSDDAESRAIRAEGYRRVGLMRYRLGELKEAETADSAAIKLGKQLAADYPSRPEFRRELAEAHKNLGVVLCDMGRRQEGQASIAKAIELLKSLVDQFPTQIDFRSALARCHNNNGITLMTSGRVREAEVEFVESIRLENQIVTEAPSRLQDRQDLALGQNNLGILLQNTGRLRQAEEVHNEALTVQRQLIADYPSRSQLRHNLARSQNNLGLLFRSTGRLKEAESAYAEAVVFLTQLAAEFPARPEFREELAQFYNNVGNLKRETGRPKQSQDAFAAALALSKQLIDNNPNHPAARVFSSGLCLNLAALRRTQRDFRGARAYVEEAARHLETPLQAKPQDPELRQFYRMTLIGLVEDNAGLGEQTGATDVAARLRDLGWVPDAEAYNAACALSQCIPIVQKDGQAAKEERDKQTAFYGDEAMKMLRDSVAKGFRDAALLKKNADFDPIREREDFKKLLAELGQTLTK